MELDIWLTFMAASMVLLLIPGPTILLVLSYALTQGRKVALASALGVATGDLLAMSASLIGLGTLVLASASLFSLLKWVGAGYLIYLGVQLLRNPPEQGLGTGQTEGAISAKKVFGHTMAVTALNPKSIAFFIAFVPQFIDPTASIAPQFAILIASFVSLAALNVMIYALLADRMRQRISQTKTLRFVNRLGGLTLIGMGLLTVTLRRAA